ncbi:MAG: acyl-CoA thioesterase [Burkholderiaceae bacterium]|nr:acyl-CoA thioesterase [Burkholderiaceae bacterium]
MPVSTRWSDNDVYGHVNNVVYYSYFDTAVNEYLIAQGVLDIENSPVVGLVIETRCQYFSSIKFPDRIQIGMRVAKIGNSSVQYELGVFANDQTEVSALGHFVHVYVDRQTNRPISIPDNFRKVLSGLVRQ